MSDFSRIPVIEMGVNTEPKFELPQKYHEMSPDWQQSWNRNIMIANALRNKINTTVASVGVAELSWSCEGRTRHTMHANQWREAMPHLHFLVNDNYRCYAFATEELKLHFRKNHPAWGY